MKDLVEAFEEEAIKIYSESSSEYQEYNSPQAVVEEEKMKAATNPTVRDRIKSFWSSLQKKSLDRKTAKIESKIGKQKKERKNLHEDMMELEKLKTSHILHGKDTDYIDEDLYQKGIEDRALERKITDETNRLESLQEKYSKMFPDENTISPELNNEMEESSKKLEDEGVEASRDVEDVQQEKAQMKDFYNVEQSSIEKQRAEEVQSFINEDMNKKDEAETEDIKIEPMAVDKMPSVEEQEHQKEIKQIRDSFQMGIIKLYNAHFQQVITADKQYFEGKFDELFNASKDQVEQFNAELEKVRTSRDEYKQRYETDETTIESQAKTIADRDEEIAKLKAEIRAKDATITGLNNTVSEKDNVINQQSVMINKLKDTVQMLRELDSEKNRNIEDDLEPTMRGRRR